MAESKPFLRRQVAATVLGQFSRAVVQLLSLLVLARLIFPADFGLIAVAMVPIGVLEILRELSLSTLLSSERQFGHQERSNFFWLSCSAGLAAYVALLLVSQPISDLTRLPNLVNVLQVAGVTLVVNGIASPHRTLLIGQLRMVELATVDFLSLTTGFASSIILASGGWGYHALVFQQVFQSFVALGVVWVLTRWRPGMYDNTVKVKATLVHGIRLSLSQVLDFLSKNADTMSLSLTSTAASLGFYTRAYQLTYAPLQQAATPMSRFVYPLMARYSSDTKNTAEKYKVMAHVFLLSFVPIFAVLAGDSDEVVKLLLGQGWSPSAAPLFFLALAGQLQCVVMAMEWWVVFHKFTGRYLIAISWSRLLFVAIIFLGSLASVLGVAVAFLVCCGLSVLVTTISLRDQKLFLAVWKFVLVRTLVAFTFAVLEIMLLRFMLTESFGRLLLCIFCVIMSTIAIGASHRDSRVAVVSLLNPSRAERG